jgi:YegS/Rv2252/BmrU family lipid kinase
MNRKVKLILNPMANMGRAWKAAVDLRPIISEYGRADWSGTVYPTHATELARQAGMEGYDMVIAVGGDGTVHEVVNGLMQVPAEKRPVLGVVPIGSGNDFAHALGIPMKPDYALMQALRGEASVVDIGLMTDDTGRKEYFDNTAGVGFDAVVTIRSHKLPLLRGVFMYLVATIETILLNHNPIKMKIEADGETFEERVLLLAACNSPREGGGFILAPSAQIDDGIMNFALIRFCSRPMMFRLLPVVMRGKHERFKQVRAGLFRTLSLTSDRPLYIHLDGEVYTTFNSNLRGVKFEILPGALQVVRG